MLSVSREWVKSLESGFDQRHKYFFIKNTKSFLSCLLMKFIFEIMNESYGWVLVKETPSLQNGDMSLLKNKASPKYFYYVRRRLLL